MSVPEGYTIVNGNSSTITVDDQTCGVVSSMLSCTGIQPAVLATVLSNAILFTIDDPVGNPNHNSMRASAGDQIFVDPARNLRMRRDGSSACVFLQAFQT